jgi:hypothetical protein
MISLTGKMKRVFPSWKNLLPICRDSQRLETPHGSPHVTFPPGGLLEKKIVIFRPFSSMKTTPS